MPVALSARGLAKTFGTRTLFSGVSLSIEDRERLALIGPNGSGKSTLLKLLAGMEHADQGEVDGRKGVRVAYVAQQDDFPAGVKAIDIVAKSALEAGLSSVHDEHEAMVEAQLLLDRMGFDATDLSVDVLSGGQKKRLSIARQAVRQPDILLLDEPTNHLDLDGIRWLEAFLRAGPFASVVVTHDRAFLESVATRIIELSRAYPKGTFGVDGNYSEFLRRKQEFLDGQAKQEQALANQVREDLRWLSRGAKARRTKSKSRIDASHERIDELADLRSRNTVERSAEFDWAATGRLTHKLLVARAITKSLGGRRLFTDVDLVLSPGSVLGLLGPNGSGKSTLIRVLTGELEPDAPTPEAVQAAASAVDVPPGTPPPGTVRRADRLRVVVFSQIRDGLDLGLTLKEALSPQTDSVIHQGRSIHIVTWARKFLFNAEQLKQPLRALSGGELARVHVARLMLEPADVLVLDEPTNDLDIPSLEVLEQSIEEFPGAVLLVTHDRAMLAGLSTSILALDGKGGARMFTDYDQWEAFSLAAAKPAAPKVAETPKAAEQPKAQPSKRRLSYNEQRELAGMEQAIERSETEVARLQGEMNDPGVLADPRRLQATCESLAKAEAEVARLYGRWQELEGGR
ncbi:MAG: ABC-F family ATP-binding cassette domain-containing protein [Phycisphaerales bacterium]